MKRAGFTLIELMIVVAIIGILAAVAIASYTIYIRESRNAEATSILADIRLKQEAYRGTFHQYAKVEDACDNWVPRDMPDSQSAATSGMDVDCRNAWRQLGISFPLSLYFVYGGAAGGPGTAATDWATGADINDFWYAAAAVQDLDDDGDCAGFSVVSGNMSMVEMPEATSVCTY